MKFVLYPSITRDRPFLCWPDIGFRSINCACMSVNAASSSSVFVGFVFDRSGASESLPLLQFVSSFLVTMFKP